MQVIINTQDKENTNEILSFIKNLNENEKNDFSVFIKGFELGKQIGAKSNAIA
ncbi:hypothetical protein [uncultured Clostridium sp.]|uniref:hypothetical protein n=1 Tax=uncultured Clostridium sp. TaxID=59620 RepID=UPI0025FE3062|nr:hypothetical protein [uncultured Clostridium sp.]